MNLNKYKEIILAGAIGDAFGYLVEFDSWERIKSKYGENGLQISNLPKDEWTVSDDTQMTLFCWDAINKHIRKEKQNLDLINKDIYISYLDWFRTQFFFEEKPKSKLGSYEELWVKEAPGQTCLSALGSKIMGSLEQKINDSKGCGGIMRVAPIIFLELSLEETFKLGCMQSAITHTHPNGYLSSGFFAGMLKLLIEGYQLDEAIQKNIEILKTYKNHEDILIYINKVTKIINEDTVLLNNKLTTSIGGGWVGDEALGIALYTVAKSKTFEEVLIMSTNHDGDSDSTASLACQLYVAKNNLPDFFINAEHKLNIKEPFNFLYNNLSKKLKEEIIKEKTKENEKEETKVEQVSIINKISNMFRKTK